MVSRNFNCAMKLMTRFVPRRASALALMVAFAAGANLCPAWAQDSEPPGLLNLFFGGSERISGERNAPSQALERTAQVGGPDLVLRLERLEAQIRQLTGTIEQLQFRNQQLENSSPPHAGRCRVPLAGICSAWGGTIAAGALTSCPAAIGARRHACSCPTRGCVRSDAQSGCARGAAELGRELSWAASRSR